MISLIVVLFAWFIPQDSSWSRWIHPQSGCFVEQVYETTLVCSSSTCELVCTSECVYNCITSNFACYSAQAVVSYIQDSINRSSVLKGPQEAKSYGTIMQFRNQYNIGSSFSCYYLSSGEVFSTRTGQNPTGSMVAVSIFALISAAILIAIILLFLRRRTLKQIESIPGFDYEFEN